MTHSYLRPSPTTPTDLTGKKTAKAWLVFSYQPVSCNSSIKTASASLKYQHIPLSLHLEFSLQDPGQEMDA